MARRCTLGNRFDDIWCNVIIQPRGVHCPLSVHSSVTCRPSIIRPLLQGAPPLLYLLLAIQRIFQRTISRNLIPLSQAALISVASTLPLRFFPPFFKLRRNLCSKPDDMWHLSVHYSRLGLPFTATRAEVIAAYRAAALKHHPDRGGSASSFSAIQESYEVLEKHVRPREYQPASLRSHGAKSDWRDLLPLLGSVVFPTAVGLGVGIRLMYTGNEGNDLRAGGTSKVIDATLPIVLPVEPKQMQKDRN